MTDSDRGTDGARYCDDCRGIVNGDRTPADYVAEADTLEDELRAFQWLRRQPDDAPVVADELGRHEGLANTGERRVVYYPDGADDDSGAWIDAPRSLEVDLEAKVRLD